MAKKSKREKAVEKSAAKRQRAVNRAIEKKEAQKKKSADKKAERKAAAVKRTRKKHKKRRQLPDTELSYFCGQMSLILKSGISSIEGIEMMEDDYTSNEDKTTLIEVHEYMRQTGELATALQMSGAFPNYMVNMIHIGEETGNLDDVMTALEEHYSREEQLKNSIQSAIFYPLLMAGMIISVIIVLLVRVMPIFNQVFKQLGTEMTGFAAVLMSLGDFISVYAPVFVAILAFLIIFAIFCVKTVPGRAFAKWVARRIPKFRELNDQIASCRFADGMSLILRSGLPPDRGFELVRRLNEDKDFEKKLDICHKWMVDGMSLSDALREAEIFSGVYSRLTSIGNKTGSLDAVMSQIASLYQDEIDAKINNLLAVLEPALIVILSVAIGAILVSVMFPLLGIMATL